MQARCPHIAHCSVSPARQPLVFLFRVWRSVLDHSPLSVVRDTGDGLLNCVNELVAQQKSYHIDYAERLLFLELEEKMVVWDAL